MVPVKLWQQALFTATVNPLPWQICYVDKTATGAQNPVLKSQHVLKHQRWVMPLNFRVAIPLAVDWCVSVESCWKLVSSQNCTEWVGLEGGTSADHRDQTPAKEEVTGLCPGGFWVSLERLHNLSGQLVQGGVFYYYVYYSFICSSGVNLFTFVTHPVNILIVVYLLWLPACFHQLLCQL